MLEWPRDRPAQRRVRSLTRSRYYPLLPEGGSAWFEGLGEAQKQELSFDEAMDWLGGLGLAEEFENWCAAVQRSVGAGREERRKILPP